MQTSAVAFKAPLARTAATRVSRANARMVVCAAQQQNVFAKAAAAGVSVPALLAAHPAFALVDERLATEGTGKIFGIDDKGLFWNMAIVFGLIWTLYFVSQRELGGDENDDAGLSL